MSSCDAFDLLLLSTVHDEDADSLKTFLLSVANRSLYLNRVHNEPNGQKCTLLMIACLAGYEGIIDMLLNYFKPDLEVLNIIKIRNNGEDTVVYQDVTVLWAAAARNNLRIVKQLVKHGALINHTTSTNSTPLRCACCNGNLDMIRYLVENGGDIHISKVRNDTNLSLSAYRKHLQVTMYLIDELKCDIDECDNDGRSALYFAVKCESLAVVSLLLSRGARNFPATHNQMSPLMLAAEKRSKDLMDAIVPYCSTLEQIEAKELIGSAFACAEHGPCDLEQCYEYFSQAFEHRSIHNLPKVVRDSTNEVFNNRQECQTMEQLNKLRLNSDNMYIEALLIRERLLGLTNKKYHNSLIYRGAILCDNDKFDRGIQLWLYELQLCQQYSVDICPEDIRRFVTLFSEMTVKSSPIPSEILLQIARRIVENIKQDPIHLDYNLHTLLFLTTITSQPSVDVLFSKRDRTEFYKLLYSINHGGYVTRHEKSSVLHLSLNEETLASDDLLAQCCTYPCLYTVRTLLRCNANVNAMDAAGNTPLHVLASNSGICDEDIFKLLCDSGAHLDYVNGSGGTPLDVASNSNIKDLIKTTIKSSLKCLCARSIKKNKVPCHGMISHSLQNFIERH